MEESTNPKLYGLFSKSGTEDKYLPVLFSQTGSFKAFLEPFSCEPCKRPLSNRIGMHFGILRGCQWSTAKLLQSFRKLKISVYEFSFLLYIWISIKWDIIWNDLFVPRIWCINDVNRHSSLSPKNIDSEIWGEEEIWWQHSGFLWNHKFYV